MIKARVVTLAAFIAFSSLTFVSGCQHYHDGHGSGTGGPTDPGSGGTIDTTGTMDQGRAPTGPGPGVPGAY